MMSSGSGGAGVGALVGAEVGAAVGAEVGAAVGSGPGVDEGPGPPRSGWFFRWRRGAGRAGALPSTTTFGFEDVAGTAGRTGSPVFAAGLVLPSSSPPIPAMA